MRKENLLLSTAVGLAVALLTAGPGAVRAQAQALSGQVTSAQGPLEGVLITAKKAGQSERFLRVRFLVLPPSR